MLALPSMEYYLILRYYGLFMRWPFCKLRFDFFLSGEGYKKKRRQKGAGAYLDGFSILYSSDSSLVQVILDARFIKFKHKTKAHHQVARWKEVLFAPYHKAPCGEILSCGCCLRHL